MRLPPLRAANSRQPESESAMIRLRVMHFGLSVALRRRALQQVVEELNRRLLVVLRVDPQHPDSGAVVDGRVLVVALLEAGNGLEGLAACRSRWT